MNQRNGVYIIAEAGVNHNGSLETAKKLIDTAAEAGVDAVKFQTFQTNQVMIPDAPKAAYQIQNSKMDETQYEMVKKLELDQDAHRILNEYASRKQLDFLSTPFDVDSLNFLVDTLNIPFLKIASGEITNAPLLLQAARSKKRILLSTGISDLGDIENALGVLAFGYTETENDCVPSQKAFKEAYYSDVGQMTLRKNVCLLHCTTEYPAPFDEVNLRVLSTLRQCFGLQVGYSDHTSGIAITLAAAALGATVIEKHITLNRNLPGPDHKASLEPHELSQMVHGIRQIERALGHPNKIPSPSELKNQIIARKSIVAACTIEKGTIYTQDNLAVKRPGGGLSPMLFFDLIGKTATKSYNENEVII